MSKLFRWNGDIKDISRNVLGRDLPYKAGELVKSLIEPYIPSKTGTLVKSAVVHSGADGSRIFYDKSYAASNYYMEAQRRNQANPRACGYWDRAMVNDLGAEFSRRLKEI